MSKFCTGFPGTGFSFACTAPLAQTQYLVAIFSFASFALPLVALRSKHDVAPACYACLRPTATTCYASYLLCLLTPYSNILLCKLLALPPTGHCITRIARQSNPILLCYLASNNSKACKAPVLHMCYRHFFCFLSVPRLLCASMQASLLSSTCLAKDALVYSKALLFLFFQ